MLISHEMLRQINDVQVEILRDVAEACKKIGIKFYMVHGSLLGTVRNSGFIPDDDDIDIAFMRNDYEKFLTEAPKYLKSKYFVQSISSDKDYPMEFAKVRDSETTYVIEVTKNLRMNHGIYIDVFPIDFCPEMTKKYQIIHKLLDMRISSVFHLENESKKRAAVRKLSNVLFPDLEKAKEKREKMNKGSADSRFLKITGGKGKERNIPKEWFSEPLTACFEGVEVFIPNESDKYLTRIYGDYKNRTLVENKISDLESIEINACKVDTKESFKKYCNF